MRKLVIIVLGVSLDYHRVLQTTTVATVIASAPMPILTPKAILLLVFCTVSELPELSFDPVVEADFADGDVDVDEDAAPDVENPSIDLTAGGFKHSV
jgi:hypothetical protein